MATASKSNKYTDFVKANPDAKFDDFHKATGGTKQNFWTARHKAGITRARATKRNQPINLGVVGKSEPTQYTLLHKRIAQLENECRSLRIIISYLEHQVGLKQSATAV